MATASQIRTSDAINEFAAAFALAQGEFPVIAKTRQGKIEGESKGSGKAYSFSYAYADISDVLSSVLPILSKHQLGVLQPTVMDGNVLTIVTRIIHSSGQWMESDYPVCSIQGDHKKMGGALTYSRRYALCSLIGVAPDEDTDGNGAEDPEPKQKVQQPRAEGRVVVTSHLDAPRSAQTPFDDEIPFGPNSGDFEPAVSTKAISLGREMKSLRSIPDMESFKRQPEFKEAWRGFNDADKKHVSNIAEGLKKTLANADLMMAG